MRNDIAVISDNVSKINANVKDVKRHWLGDDDKLGWR